MVRECKTGRPATKECDLKARKKNMNRMELEMLDAETEKEELVEEALGLSFCMTPRLPRASLKQVVV